MAAWKVRKTKGGYDTLQKWSSKESFAVSLQIIMHG
jgi:hypothetical protein